MTSSGEIDGYFLGIIIFCIYNHTCTDIMNHSEYGLVYNILYSDSDLNVTSASRWLSRIKAPFIARVATKAFTSMFTVRDGPYILSDSPSLVGKTTVRGVKRVELSEI